MPNDDESEGLSLDRSPMPSVDKALRALLELAEAGNRGLSLAELADRLAMNRSSLHVTLRALRHRRFADQDPNTGHYVLGATLLTAADLYHDNFDLRGVLRPLLVQLAGELNEVTHLAVLDGTDLLYIEKVESRRPIQPTTTIGLRLPALTTAMGRALISAQYDDYDAFERRFAGSLHPRTEHAPRTLEDEWARLLVAREAGYASDLEENVDGLCAVGIAVQLNGTPTAAVSIVALAQDFHLVGEKDYVHVLRTTLGRELRPPLSLFRGTGAVPA